MSSEQVAKCWRFSNLSRDQLLLHIALAESANDDGIGVEIVQNLAMKCRMDEVSVIETIKIMQSTALLAILHKGVAESPEEEKNFCYALLWDTLLTETKEGLSASESVGEDLQSLLDEERVEPDSLVAYVYLLKCGEYFKIGRTNNIDRRMEQLRIQLPHIPEVLHTIRTNVPAYTERLFHEKFSQFRLNGEWFHLEHGAIDFFCTFLEISKNQHGFSGYHYLTRMSAPSMSSEED